MEDNSIELSFPYCEQVKLILLWRISPPCLGKLPFRLKIGPFCNGTDPVMRPIAHLPAAVGCELSRS
jgi:hypothetical protein